MSGCEKPRMLTIRQVAREGVLSECALRRLERAGKLPCIYSGTRCLINYGKLLEQLNAIDGSTITDNEGST